MLFYALCLFRYIFYVVAFEISRNIAANFEGLEVTSSEFVISDFDPAFKATDRELWQVTVNYEVW